MDKESNWFIVDCVALRESGVLLKYAITYDFKKPKPDDRVYIFCSALAGQQWVESELYATDYAGKGDKGIQQALEHSFGLIEELMQEVPGYHLH